MEMTAAAAWLLALGAFHGVNPGMGWLFAVARGMQEGRRIEVWRALLPLAAGHTLAVGAAVLGVVALGDRISGEYLRLAMAAILIALGGRRLFRHRHPRLGGMRVGMAGLTAWSFLMATAHGAGIMLAPVLLGANTSAMQDIHMHTPHVAHASSLGGIPVGLAATALHAAGYLLVSALVAAIVYEKVGLRFLRTRWFNLDLLWALALIATGVLTLMV